MVNVGGSHGDKGGKRGRLSFFPLSFFSFFFGGLLLLFCCAVVCCMIPFELWEPRGEVRDLERGGHLEMSIIIAFLLGQFPNTCDGL